MRVKAKTWVLLEKPISPSPCNRGLVRLQTTKSQLQTVLITASGPQALNALVHRERYTQGSRQNRCVSSQKALALRAKVVGTGLESAVWKRACCQGYTGFRPCVPCSRPTFQRRGYQSGRWVSPASPAARSWWFTAKPKIANSELLTAENPTV